MARHKAMAPASTPAEDGKEPVSIAAPTDVVVATAVIPGNHVVWTPPAEGVDGARLERLRQVRIKAPDSPLIQTVTEVSAMVWVLTRERPEDVDRKEFRLLIHAVLDDALTHGDIDIRRALRKTTVDRYIDRRLRTSKVSSVRSARSILYAAGRVLHPKEFPVRPAALGPRCTPNPPVTDAQLRDLYALVGLVPEKLGRRLTIVLDLCAGAGIRTNEVLRLRGRDITALTIDGGDIAVVHPCNNAGEVRAVPVAHPGRSRRLLELSERLGDGLVLPNARNAEVSRNAVNRVNEELVRHGHRRFDALGLRNHWLLQLSQQIPAPLLLQLADLKDCRILTGQSGWLRRYEPDTAAMMLRESGL